MAAALTLSLLDPGESARVSGLRYVSDRDPGLTRMRWGKGFRYVDATGRSVREPAVLRRVRSLVIPPAWKEVWIRRFESGHLQAVGRDARGRKQYRYHPSYRTIRNETKFARMKAFGEALPGIRRPVEEDLGSRSLGKTKVLATVVSLLDSTAIRVGNEEYSRENGSFGLTTLQNEHVRIEGQTVRFRFRGPVQRKERPVA
jgi:DNA topoisomerase-1